MCAKKKINSHIQISKMIIKQFCISNENGNVYCYDFKNNKIIEKSPKKIGTKLGYFDESIEKYLSSTFEKPLGDLIHKIKKWDNDCGYESGIVFPISNDEQKSVSKFLTMLAARRPKMLEETINKSKTAKVLGVKPSPSLLISLVDGTVVKNLFKDSFMVIIKNNSCTSFISSITGFSVFLNNDEKGFTWWFPITPSLAISMVSKSQFEKVYNNSDLAIINDDEMIRYLNDKMFAQAKQDNNDYIFSNVKTELNRFSKKRS